MEYWPALARLCWYKFLTLWYFTNCICCIRASQIRSGPGNIGMLKCWFSKEFTHFLPCLSRGALPIIHCHMFQNPAFQHSSILPRMGMGEWTEFLFVHSLSITFSMQMIDVKTYAKSCLDILLTIIISCEHSYFVLQSIPIWNILKMNIIMSHYEL